MDVLEQEKEQTPFSKATIQLAKKDLGAVAEQNAQVGSKVRIVLHGTVRAISKGQVDETNVSADIGGLDIDVSKIEFAANSDIAELFSGEIDG